MIEWRCPCCGATDKHGDGPCRTTSSCYGFCCDCGNTIHNLEGRACGFPDGQELDGLPPCPKAECEHCGWKGVFPSEQASIDGALWKAQREIERAYAKAVEAVNLSRGRLEIGRAEVKSASDPMSSDVRIIVRWPVTLVRKI